MVQFTCVKFLAYSFNTKYNLDDNLYFWARKNISIREYFLGSILFFWRQNELWISK